MTTCHTQRWSRSWFAALGAMLLVSVGNSPAFAAEAPPVAPGHWIWSSRADFDACYRDRYLDMISDPSSARLVHQILIADEMGKAYNDFQTIRGKTQAKKILLLDDPDVASATLFAGGFTADCEVLVNGTPLEKPLDRTYWTGEFDRYVVPPKLLKKGPNEFVFRARPGKEGTLRIENAQWPNRSAASHDGGSSWDFDHLAEGGYCKGEFEVRLNIARYAPQAWLRSPVVDLASSARTGGVPAATGARIGRLDVQADTPAGTAVDVMVRTGATPDGYEENWSRWYAWPAEKEKIEAARFAQWQLVLRTSAPQQTPVVHRVTLAAAPAPSPAGLGPGIKSIRLDDSGNQHIVRSSYDFAYGDYDGNVGVLRKNWDLAGAVAPGKTEIQKLQLLRQWVREQWKDGWDVGPLNYVPSWDARVILTMAARKLCLGMCTHYATTYVQCSQALGYNSRSIFWGHALSETWSDDYKKWVVMDAGLDPNDRRRATYNFERNGVPLNEMEVHKAYHIEKNTKGINVVATNMSQGTDKVEPAFPDAGADDLMKSSQEIFMPFRNNFIDHRDPEEPEHGTGYVKFLDFIFWKDAVTPELGWTDFLTTREADLYWTLDQAQVFLSVPPSGDRPGAGAGAALEVMLDTVTPNFAGYEYRLDGKDWVVWNAPPHGAAPIPAPGSALPAVGTVKAYPMKVTGGCVELAWPLHAGKNTLEARPFNRAGHLGIVSTTQVDVDM